MRGVSYSEREARAAIAASLSYAEALRRPGLRSAGGNWRTLKRYAQEVWRIPTDHFDPHAAQRAALAQHRHRTLTPLSEVLVENSHYSRGTLKKRLFAEALKSRRCELCGQGEEWHGRRMALILDHVNGVATDNRIQNLQIVCPNCAATLDTHCGRNMTAYRPCEHCGETFKAGHRTQRYCSHRCAGRGDGVQLAHRALRRVERPPYEQLLAEVQALGWSAVGRRYGVSHTAIRKWVRAYERELAASARDGVVGRAAEDAAGPERDAREAEVARDLDEARTGVEGE
jgi:transposase-like protein